MDVSCRLCILLIFVCGPSRLMCGKHGLNSVFIKVFITWLSVIFYKFPQAIAGFMLGIALFMIIFSHR